jgi:hypothetical protein
MVSKTAFRNRTNNRDILRGQIKQPNSGSRFKTRKNRCLLGHQIGKSHRQAKTDQRGL